MTLTLYGHPFSSYTWKVLIALDEKQLPFGYNVLDLDHPEHGETVARLAPTGLFPVLTDGDTSIVEASAIIDDAGHSPQLEAPQAWFDAVDGFLRDPG